MPGRQTPIEVMFSLFKTSFALSHRALAELLLSDRPLTNGRPTVQMVQDTSWLSRTIVHSQPGSLEDRYFADWSYASDRILHKLREKGYSNADIYTTIASATGAIAQTLNAYGRNGLLYRNAASRLVGCQSDKDDRALISIALVISTACWCDPARSITYIIDHIKCAGNIGSFTPPSSVSSSPCDLKQTSTTYALGLIRIDNGLVVGGPYVVEPSAIGSVIGALTLEDRAVTDVGPDASARHLRIFTEGNAWYAQDLGSTNGTYLVEASNGKTLNISSGVPAQLQPGDTLRLGLSTTFAVVATTSALINQHH